VKVFFSEFFDKFYIYNVYLLSLYQFNVSLLSKSIHFFKFILYILINLTEPKLLNDMCVYIYFPLYSDT